VSVTWTAVGDGGASSSVEEACTVAVVKGEGVSMLQAREPITKSDSAAMFTFMFIVVVLLRVSVSFSFVDVSIGLTFGRIRSKQTR
jgi:hypothetical protein